MQTGCPLSRPGKRAGRLFERRKRRGVGAAVPPRSVAVRAAAAALYKVYAKGSKPTQQV